MKKEETKIGDKQEQQTIELSELQSLKMKNASQVCCLTMRLGGLLFQLKSSIFSIRFE